jgi:glyoxylase-like metal-dependent hydrolase (beta-lactamase superfamily II)
VLELAPGLWHWKAPHPQWRPTEPWDQNVSSYAVDDGERLVFFDPIAPPGEIEGLATQRRAAIVLTSPWHERDSRGLVERRGLPVYTPLPDTADSPDVAWLVREGIGEAHPYASGDRLDVGVEAFPGQKPNDTVLWVESARSVVAGDTLVDFGHGLEVNPHWLGPEVTLDQVVAGLRPLLDLPVEHMLATHGGPFDRAALARILA